MILFKCLALLFYLKINSCKLDSSFSQDMASNDVEKTIEQLVRKGYENNGWSTAVVFGSATNELIKTLVSLGLTTVIIEQRQGLYASTNEIQAYLANIIVISCSDMQEYDKARLVLVSTPWWNPRAKIIIELKKKPEDEDEHEVIGLIFYSMWWHRAIDVIIVTSNNFIYMYNYTPYVTKSYRLTHNVGCWHNETATTANLEAFNCESKCDDLKKLYDLETCISFNKRVVDLNRGIDDDVFEDQTKNLHGYEMRTKAVEILPFARLIISNGSLIGVAGRNNLIWQTLAERQNFIIDYSETKDLKSNPDYNEMANNVVLYSKRKFDIWISPMYVMDLIILKMDFLFPISASGVCMVGHKAGFVKDLFKTYSQIDFHPTLLVSCFFALWLTFYLFTCVEKQTISFDGIGYAFLMTIKAIRNANQCRIPKQFSFKVFLTITTWCFFVVEFTISSQILSLLLVRTREKVVDTLDDIIETGYKIQGFGADFFLSEDDENLDTINDRLENVDTIYRCVTDLKTDYEKFCSVDCSVAYYLEKNLLDHNGDQYLHVVSERIHSHYLAPILPYQSPLYRIAYNNVMRIVEAGLIRKWEEYKYEKIYTETRKFQSLQFQDFEFMIYRFFSVALFTIPVFIMEVLIRHVQRLVNVGFHMGRGRHLRGLRAANEVP